MIRNKRPQKRCSSHQEIEKLIDEARSDMEFQRRFGEAEKERGDLLFKWLNDNPCEGKSQDTIKEWHEKHFAAKECRKNYDKAKQRIGSLTNRLEMLKQKLAAFDTEAMSFLPDRSVV